MIDVSFLLPTNRYSSDREMVSKCIKSIRDCSDGLSIEILVYSQDEVVDKSVTWIAETVPSGPIYGFNYLATLSTGKYIACITDDQMFTSHISRSISLLDSMKTEYEICGFNVGGYCPIPRIGDVLGDRPLEVDTPGVTTLRFPFMSRKCLEKLGCVFHPSLYYHAGDIWLSYFLGKNHCQVVEDGTSISQIKYCKNSQYEVADCNKVHDLIVKNPEPRHYYEKN